MCNEVIPLHAIYIGNDNHSGKEAFIIAIVWPMPIKSSASVNHLIYHKKCPHLFLFRVQISHINIKGAGHPNYMVFKSWGVELEFAVL